jgi:hypothetical protein
MTSWVGFETAQKRLSGDTRRRRAAESLSNRDRRAPNKCGADEVTEKTEATTSSSERSMTRPPG